MRLLMIVSCCLIAVPAVADPIQYQYMFAGTLGRTSSLTRADGSLIDLSGVEFIASGVTGDLAPQWPPGALLATTTYAFGDFGSFTTDESGDRFVFTAAPDGSTAYTGLIHQVPIGALDDGRGFRVTVALAPQTDPNQLLVTDGVVAAFMPPGTVGTQSRTIRNSSGDVFRLAYDPIIPLQVTSASIQRLATSASIQSVPEPITQSVPEPNTLILLAAAGGWIFRLHHRNKSRHANTTLIG